MKLFNRNKKHVFPTNEELQNQLESLSYTYGQMDSRPFEQIKVRAIEQVNYILASQLVLILQQGRKRFGDYIYSLEGNRIVRTSDKIQLKNVDNPKIKLGSIRKIHIRPKQAPGHVWKVS